MSRWTLLATVMIVTYACVSAVWAEPFRVNGHDLSVQQIHALEFIAQTVVPALPHTSVEEPVEIAARATWWSLREGVLSDWNFKRLRVPIHQFSSCSRTLNGRDCSKKLDSKECDCLLRPLEVCDIGKAWQVGLAAVQVYTPQDRWLEQEKRVVGAVAKCWSGKKSVDQVLNEAADLAQLKGAEKDVIVRLGPGPLRTSWLLRHPVVGFVVVVEQEVTPECFPTKGPATQAKYCYNNKGEAQYYAATPGAALNSLDDLKRMLRSMTNPAGPLPK